MDLIPTHPMQPQEGWTSPGLHARLHSAHRVLWHSVEWPLRINKSIPGCVPVECHVFIVFGADQAL